MERLKTQLTPRCVRCIHSGRDIQRRHPHIITSALLVVLLRAGAVLHAQECPTETFDYGPPCDEEARQIVLDHHGADGPLLPDPEECARAERDLGLIRAAFPGFAGATHAPCCWEPNVILIETLTPADPDLVCMNLYYKVASFVGFGDWWIVTFPQSVNAPAMVEIYRTLPAVLDAATNDFGCVTVGGCCDGQWYYAPLPNGAWHWARVQSVPFHGGCRAVVSNFYVLETGRVFRLAYLPPGQFEPAPSAASVEPAVPDGTTGRTAEPCQGQDAKAAEAYRLASLHPQPTTP